MCTISRRVRIQSGAVTCPSIMTLSHIIGNLFTPSVPYFRDVCGVSGGLNWTTWCRGTSVSNSCTPDHHHRPNHCGKYRLLKWLRNHSITERKFCNINDTLKRVIGIPVNWHVWTGILTRLARYPRQNTCWNLLINYDPRDSLQRAVYVAKLFALISNVAMMQLWWHQLYYHILCSAVVSSNDFIPGTNRGSLISHRLWKITKILG